MFTLFIACRSLLAPYLAIEILVSVLAKARFELSRHIPEEKRVQYAILSVTLHITLCIYFINSFANIEIYYGRFRVILEISHLRIFRYGLESIPSSRHEISIRDTVSFNFQRVKLKNF